MKSTFNYWQEMVQDPDKSSTILDVFPRYLDTPGLINQDLTQLFGKVAHVREDKVITNSKSLPSSEHIEDLLSTAQLESDYGWDSGICRR
ncbi:hypothetical protein DPEC_G00071550 [Dallia pectoralis]|uniref:Uncharacterized protein n=1 Tax=Dallia pectoralis TaxID=75939 RepID=A0ACC2H2C3_DALPE|nr:hypothetical protein DPEC_G00071550 [Dallia pectoralis]